jgi:ABC-2 type transport system permease protein
MPMTRSNVFAGRNIKEIVRDPVNLFFGLGFSLILLVLLSVINANIPAQAHNTMFAIDNLAPGLAMFGSAFMSLFVGMLVAKDRTTSFLTRLFTSPMTATNFLLGYSAAMLAMTAVLSAITFLASGLFGLRLTVYILPAIVVTTVVSLLFIGFGLLCGSLLTDKAVSGMCGGLLVNVAGWLSGVFIPVELIGGAFKVVTEILPFYHGVQAVKDVLAGDFIGMLPHLGIVMAYAMVVYIAAIFAFRSKMSQ